MSIQIFYKNTLITIMITSLCAISLMAQKPNYTANETVNNFSAPFGYGVNPGYYGDNLGVASALGFDRQGVSYDVAIAQLAANLGLNTTRPSLPCYFFLSFGNGIVSSISGAILSNNNFQLRTTEFGQYPSMGIKNQVVFIGDATDHQDGQYNDPTNLAGHQYRNLVKYPGCGYYSYEFKNLNTPIWDNGENGTPINDTNYYALYIYKLVTNYKSYIKVYEIVNEIDFAGAGYNASTTGPDTWWTRAPKPCELLNWRAPIYSYIRTLRIAYEVVKSLDPTAFIAIGGIGNESFLDATLRYTDNPIDGSVTSDYPKKGGAYFDVLSYHHYPFYDLLKKNPDGVTNVYPPVYQRHSDEAAYRTAFVKKASLQSILTKYLYDGSNGNFPLKHFIITEANIPRRTYPGYDWIGSDIAQRNYNVKLFIKAQVNNLKQVHIFKLGESNDLSDVSNTEGHEGYYQNLTKASRTTAKKLQSGIAVQTLTKLVGNSVYDATQTSLMAFPASIDGAAFKSTSGKYTYVIWAKTTTDNVETNTGVYTFPSSLGISSFTKADWDYSFSGLVSTINSNVVNVAGSPAFFKSADDPIPASVDNIIIKNTTLRVFPNPSSNKTSIAFALDNSDEISLSIVSIDGQKIDILLNKEYLSSGEHFYEFDNLRLASGIYFIIFKSNKTGISTSSKLVIIE